MHGSACYIYFFLGYNRIKNQKGEVYANAGFIHLLTADRFPLVRDIGKNRTDGIYTHHDRILDFDVFLFVIKGRMQVIEGGTEYFVGEMEHLFLKKERHHWGLPLTLPGTTWYWIHFNTVIDERISYSDHLPMPELDYYFPDQYQYRLSMPKHGTSAVHQTLENRLQLLLNDFEAPREAWYDANQPSGLSVVSRAAAGGVFSCR